jgi:hypothetical protein
VELLSYNNIQFNINSFYLPTPRSKIQMHLQLVWLRLGSRPLVTSGIAEFIAIRGGEVVKDSGSARA